MDDGRSAEVDRRSAEVDRRSAEVDTPGSNEPGYRRVDIETVPALQEGGGMAVSMEGNSA